MKTLKAVWNRKFIGALAAILVIVAAGAWVLGGQALPQGTPTSPASPVSVQKPSSSELIQCLYFTEKDFKSSLRLNTGEQLNDTTNTSLEGHKILGGIVPHHLLAGGLIAGFFHTLSAAQPDVVVILGPNHKRAGTSLLHTGDWAWNTPSGLLEADSEITGQLEDKFHAGTRLELLEKEHSISSLVPYLHHYMPKAKIVPILLHGSFGLENSKRLGKELIRMLEGKKALVIASVDFSHYLPVDQADQMDKESLEAIQSRDLTKISQMTNDNLDSPPCIISILSAMDAAGSTGLEVLGHDNSSRIAGRQSDNTTSYYTLAFTR